MKTYHQGLTTSDYELIDARLGLVALDGGIRSNQAPADLKDRDVSGDTAAGAPFKSSEQPSLNFTPPYPWCSGNPEDCIKVGYCRRDPNCGE